ncbi:MAG: TorF family putative porin [Pseudazoarcus pumilus]|nr:TorF family putative porin [Pseudazoarcus pumilus]
MKKTLIAAAVLAATPFVGANVAMAEGELPISANISIVSDYAFRGISQTDQRPAIQGGFDWEHDSGFYAGFWASNVSWLNDLDLGTNNSLETNLYAGYATSFGPIGVDVGLLQYYYPGDYGTAYKAAGNDDPHTLEGYIGLSWEFLTFTYSHSFTNLFGYEDSKNSKYYNLAASYEIMDGLTLDASYGYSNITGQDNYKDWKLGVTKSYGGVDFGLHYTDTDISNSRIADGRFILSVGKSF